MEQVRPAIQRNLSYTVASHDRRAVDLARISQAERLRADRRGEAGEAGGSLRAGGGLRRATSFSRP